MNFQFGVRPDKIMVVSIALIIFNSGGFRIIDNYIITLMVWFLMTFRFLLSKRIDARFLIGSLMFAMLLVGLNYILANFGMSPKKHFIFLSYMSTGIILVALYSKIKSNFVLDLYVALKFFMWISLLGVVLMPLVHEKGILFGVLNYSVFHMGGLTLPRNASVFWEPGVLQLFMNILFYLSLFIMRDRKIMVLSMIVIISTLSTAAYVILAMQIGWYYMFHIKQRHSVLFLLKMLVGSLITVAVIVILQLKLTGDQHKSADVRKLDLVVAVSLIQTNPWVGIGLNDENFRDAYSIVGRVLRREYAVSEEEIEGKGLTNGFLYMVVTFGIPLGLVFLFLLYKQEVINGRLIFFILLLGTLTEPIFQTSFYAIFLAYGLREIFYSRKTEKKYNASRSNCVKV